MTDLSKKATSQLLLRRIFLYVTILALVFAVVDFFMTRYDYLNNERLLLEVQIDKSNDVLNTWSSVEIGGTQFKFGETGTISYQPKSLFKAVLYGFYSKPPSPMNLLDCFVMFSIGLYLYIFSFYISEKEFFSGKTYIMFVCLVFLIIILKWSRGLVMSSIDDMFFHDTGNIFNFYTQKGGVSVIYIMNFIFILFNIIWARAQIVQKEQELTI